MSVFKWVSKTLVFHRGVGHVIKAIEDNDGYGLGQISETCLESSNKTLRHSSEKLARQHNDYVNKVDCLNFMWYSSDPLLQKKYAIKTAEKTQVVEDLDLESKKVHKFIHGDYEE